jgi:hypothetical protein
MRTNSAARRSLCTDPGLGQIAHNTQLILAGETGIRRS